MENSVGLSTHKLVDNKNEYSLSLIIDILNGVRKRKVFTRLDLRWGYNNIRIKKEDK